MTGEKCSHHVLQDAVQECKICGKPICKDCLEIYNMENETYRNEPFCYDCIGELVKENTANEMKFRKKVTTERVMALLMSVVLMFVGSALLRDERGEGVPLLIIILGAVLLGGCIAVMPEIIKAFKAGDVKKGLACMFGAYIFMARTRRRQLEQCVEIATSDSFTISRIRNYYAYTQFMEKNKDADLAKLTAPGGRLNDNQYAKDVLEKGEAAARGEMRRNVIQIAENNENGKNLGEIKVK